MALRKKKAVGAAALPTAQPGTVVVPGSTTVQSAGLPRQSEDRFVPSTTAKSVVAPPSDNHQASGGSLFRDNEPEPAQDDGDAIKWTASEYIAHQKSVGWYTTLGLGAIVLAALVYLLTKDKISTAVVLVGAFILGFYGARQPRQLEYQLDTQGVKIGRKYYLYSDFRSFAVVPEGAFSSIIFMPLKRFAPLTTIYYAPADEDRIVQLLSNILPIQEYRHDPVDQFMKRIRF